ncbi:MAG: SDR family NAD(P)-dependent oxidoreductase [Leptospiraceae bacterium]|nr:SDR family NAD(P)-dependent oxidoreductase [Leptospiraceae bacterium]MBK7058285.1 SDR family NAD(P)-dependent oxidoreductase [Leptospiraceae bacterium]
MKINGKRIVITGAASGIGKETLLLLKAYSGVKILATDLNIQDIEQSEVVSSYQCDVSNPDNLKKLIQKAEDVLGGIDIFYANAGFAYYEKIQDPSWDRIENIYNTNVFSPAYTVAYLNEKLKNPFLFIVTASAMSHLPLPGYALYAATKSAVHSFMESFRYELKPANKIMVIYPIATRTKFFTTAGKEVPVPFPSQSAQAVAKSIVRGINWNSKRVYPSFLFRLIQYLDRFLIFPLKVYQILEGIKLKRIIK